MSVTTETAQEFIRLADRSLDRDNVAEALHYLDRAKELLRERSAVPDRSAEAGTLKGESVRYGHLGKVLAAKHELAQGVP